MHNNALKLGKKDSSEDIYHIIKELVGNNYGESCK